MSMTRNKKLLQRHSESHFKRVLTVSEKIQDWFWILFKMRLLEVLRRPPLYNTILPQMDPASWTQGRESERLQLSLSLFKKGKRKKKKRQVGRFE